MSFDVGVWHEDAPITTDEAQRIYQELGEPSDGLKSHANIAKFVAELSRQFPQPSDCDESSLDACPWSGDFDASDRHVLISIAHSQVDRMIPVIADLAAELDLTYFDPQWPCVLYPPRVAAQPHLRLTSEDFTVIDNPSARDIEGLLRSLGNGNSFAIFERTDLTYMQAALQEDGVFIFEYQEGSLDHHFQTTVDDIDVLVHAFVCYGAGDDSWTSDFTWTKLDLG